MMAKHELVGKISLQRDLRQRLNSLNISFKKIETSTITVENFSKPKSILDSLALMGSHNLQTPVQPKSLQILQQHEVECSRSV